MGRPPRTRVRSPHSGWGCPYPTRATAPGPADVPADRQVPDVGAQQFGVGVRLLGQPACLPLSAHNGPVRSANQDSENRANHRSGVTRPRRRELIGWADAGGLVCEDDYDAEHRYDRPPVPALRALRPKRVCYTGSVSKLLAPALRIGWALVPAAHRDALVAAKRFADLGSPVLHQLVLARPMDSGTLERHLRLLRGRHRRRRDAMIAAVGRHLPGAVVHGAAAGLHQRKPWTARWTTSTSPRRRWPAGSRCSRCPGTGSGRATAAGSSWVMPRAPRRDRFRAGGARRDRAAVELELGARSN